MEILKTILTSATGIFEHASNISVGIASVSLVIGYILAVLGYYIIRDYGVPPGPTGVPFLGYWPFIDSANAHLQQITLKKKYGDIFSFRVTGTLYINLASIKMLKEAHLTKSDFFTQRTSQFNILARIMEKGVIFSRGEKWQATRRYFLSQFRDRGMTLFKEHTADTVDEIIGNLVEELKRKSDKPIDIIHLLTLKSNRILRNTLFGLASPVTEKEIESIEDNYRGVSSLFHSSNLLLVGNLAKYLIIPFLPFYSEALKLQSNVKKTFQKMIDDHRRTFENDNIRDIIDCFIQEKNLRRSKGDPTHEYFTDETLVSNLLQFVGDGVVNVATFVTFMIMKLLDHPEEQEKIYQELLEVCGEDRNPTLSDKSKLPYFNAFLQEAHRTSNFIPLFPSLECTKETTVGGYRIPKGAITVSNVYAMHNDSQVYENPDQFNPSRFLGKDGKPREELPITFGVGKRVCLGEGFVLIQTFVFLAALVKNFKLSYEVPKKYFEVQMDRKLNVRVIPRK